MNLWRWKSIPFLKLEEKLEYGKSKLWKWLDLSNFESEILKFDKG